MENTLEGYIYHISPIENKKNNFQSRFFVILFKESKNSKFEEKLKFELIQQNCYIADTLAIGDSVKVFFNFRGREWVSETESKFFTTLQAWKIEALDGKPDTQPAIPTDHEPKIGDGPNDIPF